MKPARHNPPQLFDSRSAGFSQAVVADAGARVVHVSGQVAWDADRTIVGPGDMHAQVVHSLKNLKIALEHAGASIRDVHALRIYIRHDVIEDTAAVSRGLVETFGEDLPCATWIGVPALAHAGFLVEIEPAPVAVLDADLN